MANLEPLIQSIPVAPLKLASLEGCRTLADQVNNYLVSFRHESPTNVGQADPVCRVTVQILICWSVNAYVSEAAKEKAF